MRARRPPSYPARYGARASLPRISYAPHTPTHPPRPRFLTTYYKNIGKTDESMPTLYHADAMVSNGEGSDVR